MKCICILCILYLYSSLNFRCAMFGALTLDNRPSVSPGMDSGRPSLTVKHRLRGTDSGVAEHTIGMCGIEEMLLILWVTVIFCKLSQFIKNFFQWVGHLHLKNGSRIGRMKYIEWHRKKSTLMVRGGWLLGDGASLGSPWSIKVSQCGCKARCRGMNIYFYRT